ncbi:hypothetical protein H671_3g9771 [Cricetulus griseus]|nr:hypothetical protein H671_3g9771 [Cricetulus griseus]
MSHSCSICACQCPCHNYPLLSECSCNQMFSVFHGVGGSVTEDFCFLVRELHIMSPQTLACRSILNFRISKANCIKRNDISSHPGAYNLRQTDMKAKCPVGPWSNPATEKDTGQVLR